MFTGVQFGQMDAVAVAQQLGRQQRRAGVGVCAVFCGDLVKHLCVRMRIVEPTAHAANALRRLACFQRGRV